MGFINISFLQITFDFKTDTTKLQEKDLSQKDINEIIKICHELEND